VSAVYAQTGRRGESDRPIPLPPAVAAISGRIWYALTVYKIALFAAGAIAYWVIQLLVRRYLPAYISEKGKNLATKEDIAAITRQVETVRHEYSALLEELRGRHQLRTASLDLRLRAHQEAFTYWRGLLGASTPEDAGKAVMACQSWWERNCLYLEPKVRQAFVEAYSNAHMRAEFLRARSDSKYIIEAWAKVTAFPNVLFEAVQLPPLTETESNALAQSDKGGSGQNDSHP
jgi:hypothetical protein